MSRSLESNELFESVTLEEISQDNISVIPTTYFASIVVGIIGLVRSYI